MRKSADLQSKLWGKNISDIEFDLKSRDEIPKLLLGLQHIFIKKDLRDQVFSILREMIPRTTNKNTGRHGMDLWKILVLGALRLNCNWDYDKVHDIANNHFKIRQMLGHDDDDQHRYGLQTIRDNIQLFTPEILNRINVVVVKEGHRLKSKPNENIKTSCDSFVVETNVHYPTDTNLLYDAMRKMITIIAAICSEVELSAWRQSHKNLLNVKRKCRSIENLWRRKPKTDESKKAHYTEIVNATNQYLGLCRKYLDKTTFTISFLQRSGLLNITQGLRLDSIEEYIQHAERQMDQIKRRVIADEKIPHCEKVFSIFEPHTEWISKGKAGVPQELGLRVCIIKDQNGYILNHMVMEKETDDKVAVSIVQETQKIFPNVTECSFDKGFYSPSNRERLNEILDHLVMPKKGKKTQKDKEVEGTVEFKEARKKHSAVEASISALENHGLDRCLDHGAEGFKRYVALSILARNLQILGHQIQQQKKKQKQRMAA